MASDDAKPAAPVGNRSTAFNWAPDPWREVVTLEFGGDRSFATTVQAIVFAAEPSEFAGVEKKLITALQNPKCTLAAKDHLCRLLGVVGSEACLDAVTPLLGDEKTSHLARLALEPITGDKIDAVLRDALPKLNGAAKAGLIGTIGVRASDKAAVTALEKIQTDASEPAVVREAAANALSRIRA